MSNQYINPWTEEERKILKEKYPKQGTDIEELDRSKKAIRSKAGKLGIKYSRKKTLERKELDYRVAYILGVCYGDATLRYRERNGGVMKFSVTDKEFYQKTKEFLKEWTGFHITEYETEKKNQRKGYCLELNSYEVVKFLKSISLKDIKKSNEKVKKYFIKGFADSEGNVQRGKIRIGNTNKRVLEFVKELLEGFDIESYIRLEYKNHPTYENAKPYYMLYIGKIHNSVKYRHKIGLTIQRKAKRVEKYEERVKAREKRYEAYKKVMELREENGWGPTKLHNELKDEYTDLTYYMICGWIYKNKHPLGLRNK